MADFYVNKQGMASPNILNTGKARGWYSAEGPLTSRVFNPRLAPTVYNVPFYNKPEVQTLIKALNSNRPERLLTGSETKLLTTNPKNVPTDVLNASKNIVDNSFKQFEDYLGISKGNTATDKTIDKLFEGASDKLGTMAKVATKVGGKEALKYLPYVGDAITIGDAIALYNSGKIGKGTLQMALGLGGLGLNLLSGGAGGTALKAGTKLGGKLLSNLVKYNTPIQYGLAGASTLVGLPEAVGAIRGGEQIEPDTEYTGTNIVTSPASNNAQPTQQIASVPPIDEFFKNYLASQNSNEVANLPPISQLANGSIPNGIVDGNITSTQPANIQNNQELLEAYRQLAEQRQGIYQPYIDYLSQAVGNIDDTIRERNRDSHISAGLAGLAGNPYIYSAYTSRNPITDIENTARLKGDLANTQNKLMYDDTQAQADMALAQALGLPAETALAQPDFMKNALGAVANNQDLAYKKALMNIELNKIANSLEQQKFSNALAYAQLQQQQQELAEAGKLKILPSVISALGYSGADADTLLQVLSAYGFQPNIPVTTQTDNTLQSKDF